MLHENRGIIPRIVDGIFERIRNSGVPDCFVVKCSMLEVRCARPCAKTALYCRYTKSAFSICSAAAAVPRKSR